MILPVLFPFFSPPSHSPQQQVALPWAHSVVFHEECDSTAVCLKQPGEAGRPWRNGGKTCCRLEAGQKTRGVGSSLPSPSGPLSILLLLPPHPPPLPPFCSSAPPHPLFMSAWIAPFHYIQLPAHYQSHRRFNNRSPTPPPLPCAFISMTTHNEDSEKRREWGNRQRQWWGGKKKKNVNEGLGVSPVDLWFLFVRRETFGYKLVRLNCPVKDTLRAALLIIRGQGNQLYLAKCASKIIRF